MYMYMDVVQLGNIADNTKISTVHCLLERAGLYPAAVEGGTKRSGKRWRYAILERGQTSLLDLRGHRSIVTHCFHHLKEEACTFHPRLNQHSRAVSYEGNKSASERLYEVTIGGKNWTCDNCFIWCSTIDSNPKHIRDTIEDMVWYHMICYKLLVYCTVIRKQHNLRVQHATLLQERKEIESKMKQRDEDDEMRKTLAAIRSCVLAILPI